MITKGMILCAGLGTRLLPITERVPKPLVPVLNVPNLVHTLFLLRRAGIRDVIVNVFHLHEQIEKYLGDGSRWEMKISYSHETVLLGTGGGVKKAERFFEGKPFVLANCDFVTDVNISPFIAQHQRRHATATMILLKDEKQQPLYSKVGADSSGHLCSLPRVETRRPAETGIFTGIHILENDVLQHLEEKPCGINEVLYPYLMKEKPTQVWADFMQGYWYDTGDIPMFYETSLALLERLAKGDTHLRELLDEHGHFVEKKPGVWIARESELPNSVEFVGPVLVDKGCKIGSGAKLGPNVILGENSEVGEGAKLARFVGLGVPRIPSAKVSEGTFQFGSTELSLKKSK